MSSNKLEQERGKQDIFKSISEIVLKVVKYKLKDDMEEESYNNLTAIASDMEEEVKKR